MKHRNKIRIFAARLATALSLLTGAAAAAQGAGPDPAVADRVVLRLKPGISIAAFHLRYGSAPAEFAIPSREIHVVRPPLGEAALAFADRIDREPEAQRWVVWAELEYVGDAPEGSARIFFFLESPDPGGYTSQPAWDQIDLSGATEVSTGGGVTVAVVDTGVDPGHPALAGKIAPGAASFAADSTSFLDAAPPIPIDSDGDGTPNEMVGHGTHVAGIISWTAPDALILPIKVLDADGNTTNTRLSAGIFHAIDVGADVINVSAGSTYNSKSFEDAIGEARARGIPVIAAAGNLNRRTPEEFPAMQESAIGVGAVGADDRRADFSNYHERLALVAPGEAVFSALPAARYAAWDGTSFATPMVAGAAALLIADRTEWPASEARVDQVRAFLQAGATPIDALNPGYEGMLGAGRLDVSAALRVELLFEPQTPVDVGPGPIAITTADFNNDGRADLALAKTDEAALAVLLGRVGGAFEPPIPLPVTVPAVTVVAADFDGDDWIDLAALDDELGRLSLFRNLGGSFAPAITLFACAGNGLVAADFTGDGRLDLLSTCEDFNAARLYRNTGGFAFVAAGDYPAGTRPETLAAGDVDGDGDIDAIVSNRQGEMITLLRNNGFGGFVGSAVPCGQDPRLVHLADLDGDGDLDALTGNHRGPGISILRNNGSGGFSMAATLVVPGDRVPQAFAVADMDCDGDRDVAFTSEEVGTQLVSILLNTGGAGLSFTGPLSYTTQSGPIGVALPDFDSDGDPDVVVANNLTTTISRFRNGTCARRSKGDLNCDGVVNFDDIDAFVLAVLGPVAYRQRYPDCPLPLADLTGDGRVNFDDISPFVERVVSVGG